MGGAGGRIRETALGRDGVASRNQFLSPAQAQHRERTLTAQISPSFTTRSCHGNRSISAEQQLEDDSAEQEEVAVDSRGVHSGRRLIDIEQLEAFVLEHCSCKQCSQPMHYIGESRSGLASACSKLAGRIPRSSCADMPGPGNICGPTLSNSSCAWSTNVLPSTVHTVILVVWIIMSHTHPFIAVQSPPGCPNKARELQNESLERTQRTIVANTAPIAGCTLQTSIYIERACLSDHNPLVYSCLTVLPCAQ